MGEDCLAQPNLQVGDRIISINDQCRELTSYVRSPEVCTNPAWTLVVERYTEDLSMQASNTNSTLSGEINFSIGKSSI